MAGLLFTSKKDREQLAALPFYSLYCGSSLTFIYQPQGPPSTSINYIKLAPISAAFTNPSENKDPQDSCLKLSGWTLSLPALQQLGTGNSGASCRLIPLELPFTSVDVRYLHLILSQKIHTFCNIELLPFGS